MLSQMFLVRHGETQNGKPLEEKPWVGLRCPAVAPPRLRFCNFQLRVVIFLLTLTHQNT